VVAKQNVDFDGVKVIQIINRYLNFGGEENSANRMAKHIQEGGAELKRFVRSSEEWMIDGAPPKWKQPFLLGYNTAVLSELAEQHKAFKADVWILHNVLPVVSIGVYKLARELDVPVVQWLHNYRPLSLTGHLSIPGTLLKTTDSNIHLREMIAGAWNGRARTAALAFWYAWARHAGWFRSVTKWVAVSEKMRQNFEDANWFPDRLEALHHSWDLGEPVTETRSANKFLFLGRLMEEKGILELIEVFSTPSMEGLELVIAGDGPLKDYIASLEQRNIRYVGWVSGTEKKKLIRQCSAVIFPSLWEEPLSTIAYEAYEQERPIISSDRGGMVEVITDCMTGRVLPVGDREIWRGALLELANNEELADTWGRNGCDWLKNNVSPQIWFGRFEEIINDAITQHKTYS